MAEGLADICLKADPIYSPQPVMVEECSAFPALGSICAARDMAVQPELGTKAVLKPDWEVAF